MEILDLHNRVHELKADALFKRSEIQSLELELESSYLDKTTKQDIEIQLMDLQMKKLFQMQIRVMEQI